MDNFYNDGDDTAASASEFVFELSSGGHVAITDEAMGFGFITIEQYDNVACTAAQTLGGESNWSTTVAFSAATFGLISANLF